MIPPATDHRWRQLVSGWQQYRFESLAARMLITRLRIKTVRGDESSITAAIGVAHEFFEKNEATTLADLKLLFGDET
ncbi:MAG TPA: hypothetical protein VGD87_15385 [Archangium sp.]|jgi:hypothetical protein